jgi:hypothetical protein
MTKMQNLAKLKEMDNPLGHIDGINDEATASPYSLRFANDGHD